MAIVPALSTTTLPVHYGVCAIPGRPERRLCAHLAGHGVLDLRDAVEQGRLAVSGALNVALRSDSWHPVLCLGRDEWDQLYGALARLAVNGADALSRSVLSMSAVRVELPVAVANYTDFYSSIDHATNVGRMFRPDHPLLPNYRHVPIAYHGRASSIVGSGTAVRRPNGQRVVAGDLAPSFGPTQQLDYELEVGFIVGGRNAIGDSVPIGRAHRRLFGVVLLNDWSARDIQAWEYQPLGPFLSKSFATTISGWVLPIQVLDGHRVPARAREADAPPVLPYLTDEGDRARGAFDVDLRVHVSSARMRELGLAPHMVSRGNLRDLYWTVAQMVAHHSSNGCNLEPGDLLGTGTISGASLESRGCLLELTDRGRQTLVLPSGERRGFLEDGDEVTLSGPPLSPCVGRIANASAT